jgi:hypothetical protein
MPFFTSGYAEKAAHAQGGHLINEESWLNIFNSMKQGKR